MTWWNRSGVNPYWLKEYNPNKDSRNRFDEWVFKIQDYRMVGCRN